MLHLRCPRRRSLTMLVTLAALSFFGLWLSREAPAQPAANKRPLTHNDYDSWRSIQGQQLSPDGKYVAYTLVPQNGDSELVVRHLEFGKEYRHPLPAAKGGALPQAGFAGRVAFTADSKRVIFTIPPPKADQEPAKKGAKETPKTSLGIMDLTTGKTTILPNVRSFQVPEFGGGLVYQKFAPVEPPDGGKKTDPPAEDDDDDFFQPAKKGGDKKTAQPARQIPSDVVVRNLVDGSEITIADVVEYSLTRDSSLLICAISTKVDDSSGVFAFYPAKVPGKLDKQALAVGKAKYMRLTWDEQQRFLAFFAERSTDAKEPPTLSLFVADRAQEVKNDKKDTPLAVEMVTMKTPGFKDAMVLTERGALTFSDDGMRLFFGVAPPPEKEPDKAAAKDKAVVELWHWKDDFIQPMQKVRAAQEKNRTFRAVVHLKERKVVQLADKTVADIMPSRDGRWALGSDDKPHRPLVAYDAAYADWYLIDTMTGSRKPLLKKHHWPVTWSAQSRYVLFFDGKDWNSISVPDGSVINLTKPLGVKFYYEEHDSPNSPAAYGVAGWTPDDYFVLLYDKYDIWKVAAKGGGHEILTRGVGREGKTQLRYVKLDLKEKSIDLSKPVLLRAENVQTRDSGFYRLDPGVAPPQPLIMQPRFFGTPILAKFADVFLLTAATFNDFPDLYVTRSAFKLLARVSDANPQKEKLLWGKSEMIHYKNSDGVALSGILIKPDNFDPKKKYPMIVYIYERLSNKLHQFVNPAPGTSINPSYYASNGYLVLMPDITYTVGYPGQSALKCVLPAIQKVADMGCLDEDAIGIQGHSWGGYQIAYMVTQTKRFKAAAAGAPVTNMTSAYGGIRWGSGLPRQFQYEKTQSRIGGSLWEHPLRFIENSPVFMADRVKAPLLMLHNDQDNAVPWYQGIEFYLALRRLGKEVYLFNYPGELHGLAKRPNQKDFTIRMQEFFDHHLKGAPMPGWMANGIPYTPPPGALKGPPDVE
jgi:dienelactone hydrolase